MEKVTDIKQLLKFIRLQRLEAIRERREIMKKSMEEAPQLLDTVSYKYGFQSGAGAVYEEIMSVIMGIDDVDFDFDTISNEAIERLTL